MSDMSEHAAGDLADHALEQLPQRMIQINDWTPALGGSRGGNVRWRRRYVAECVSRVGAGGAR